MQTLFVSLAAALSPPPLRCRPPLLCAPAEVANPFLAAPGEDFKKAVYTKADSEIATGIPEEEDEPPQIIALPYASSDIAQNDELRAVRDSVINAIENIDPDGQEAYGDWIREDMRKAVLAALTGLRGRKLFWWLDAPRPVRVVIARDTKFEIALVGLPGGATLPAAAFPRGSVMFCQPLLGSFTLRRLRFDITSKVEAPIELMKRTLKAGDKPLLMPGGACHEYFGLPGVASAYLQVAMLPPTSNMPARGSAADGSIGWRRPPGETTEQNTDVVSGVTIGVDAVSDVLLLDRPTIETLTMERELDRSLNPDDKNALVEKLSENVGGLDNALTTIVRRALASRLYPPNLTRPLGISPVRGMLLYGPPGCGKTLLAREIASAMGAREPKIVNGPEMMSKYVGDSEEFVRSLFAEAEVEQAEAGIESALHVIVFDEMDAFTRERGSLTGDTSGIRDSVVNQLLAKMDGVDQLDNILVIGLTNRPELMDPALLRPGRLEVQVEIQLPDVDGRKKIVGIHSKRLRERSCLDTKASHAISSGALAEVTKGFSGADLAGLIRSATSFALERYVEGTLLQGYAPGTTGAAVAAQQAASESRRGLLEVSLEDLIRALREVHPTGSAASRAELRRSGGKGRRVPGVLWAANGVRAWRREKRLRAIVERAAAASNL